MGKQRFRLSHMIPNAWFYRLRDMNTTANNKKPLPSAYSSTPNHTKNSFCYTPRVDRYSTSIYIPPAELTHTHDQDLFLSPTSTSYHQSPFSESTQSLDRPPFTYCNCGVLNSSTTDVVIKLKEKSYTKRIQDTSEYELIHNELQKPPPILTKPNKETLTMVEKKEETSSQSSISIKIVKESISKKENNPKRKPVSGVCKMNLSSSCCIVKSSMDPHEDLKKSMMEMIVEENIWASKDLEKLLAAYISLNSNEYHDVIIKAFEEIWLTFEFVE